mgnify:CR=1 FL=1
MVSLSLYTQKFISCILSVLNLISDTRPPFLFSRFPPIQQQYIDRGKKNVRYTRPDRRNNPYIVSDSYSLLRKTFHSDTFVLL